MSTHWLSLVLLTTATAACVTNGEETGRTDDVQEDWRSGGKGDGETCDFDQMSAPNYYAQFAYQLAGIPGESENDWRYQVGITFAAKPVLDNGNKANLKIYFLEDARVVAEYYELEATNEPGLFNALNETVIVTRAKIDTATRGITLEGIGSGTPTTVRNERGCAAGINFTFSRDLRSAGLAGDGAVIQEATTSAFVIDPDHLEEVPNQAALRTWQQDVRSGRIAVIRL